MDKINFDFKNRTALVTGGAQGFGLDIAKRFLESGAKVIIWDIDSKMIEKAQKDFPNVLFLSFEQTKNKDFANLLNVKYWATIIVYKNSKEIAKEIGVTSKDDIYSLIRKEI